MEAPKVKSAPVKVPVNAREGSGVLPGDSPQAAPAQAGGLEILGVSQVTGRIAGRLSGLGTLAIEGEVSALKRAGSGHLYFNLKDEKASLSCAVWRSRVATGVKFDLQDGQQVLCRGKLDVYAPRGNYSLIVERVERRGMGEQLARLEKLKEQLRAKGWFDRSRPIPARPKRIGLVTSRDADALRDFLRTRSLRWAGYPVRLCHTRVQGPGSAEEIARAIARLDDGRVDVICVVRGGGSLEDLWAFNELPVAQAVWNCSVPVISGVGHESDTTLIDWVADVRAHTPTNAGEHAIPDRGGLMERVERASAYMEAAIDRQLRGRESALERLANRACLSNAEGLLRAPLQAVAFLESRLSRGIEGVLVAKNGRLEGLSARVAANSPQARLSLLQQRLDRIGPRIRTAMENQLQRREAQLQERDRWLEAISPLAVLGRGYSIVQSSQSGGVVRKATELAKGEEIQITFAEGKVQAEVQRRFNEGENS